MPTKFRPWAVPTFSESRQEGIYGPKFVSGTKTYYRWSDTVVTGGGLPGWKQLIASGKSATTSLDGTRLSLGKVTGQFLTVYPRKGSTCTKSETFGNIVANLSPGGWIPPTGSAIDSVADDKARSKLLEHYISSTRKFYGSGFIAEVRENIEMFKKPLKSFREGFGSIAAQMKSAVKHGVGNSPGQLRKALGNMWLEWSFGIKPTISDLNDLSEAVNGAWRGSSSLPLTGFGRNTLVTVEPRVLVSIPTWYALPRVYCERRAKRDNTVRYKGATRCSGSPGGSLQRFGLDLLDIPGGIWEGTPYSWLVDYFANVGEVLDSMRLAFVDVAWLNRTVRNATTINVMNYRCEDGSMAIGPSRSYALGTGVSRRRIDAIPYPQLHLQIPGLSSTKWLNTASVVQQFEWIESRLRRLGHGL